LWHDYAILDNAFDFHDAILTAKRQPSRVNCGFSLNLGRPTIGKRVSWKSFYDRNRETVWQSPSRTPPTRRSAATASD
jgi:hypothetical protein